MGERHRKRWRREGSREWDRSGSVGGRHGIDVTRPCGRQCGAGGHQTAPTDFAGAFVELPSGGELDEGQLSAHGNQYDEGV